MCKHVRLCINIGNNVKSYRCSQLCQKRERKGGGEGSGQTDKQIGREAEETDTDRQTLRETEG